MSKLNELVLEISKLESKHVKEYRKMSLELYSEIEKLKLPDDLQDTKIKLMQIISNDQQTSLQKEDLVDRKERFSGFAEIVNSLKE